MTVHLLLLFFCCVESLGSRDGLLQRRVWEFGAVGVSESWRMGEEQIGISVEWVTE